MKIQKMRKAFFTVIFCLTLMGGRCVTASAAHTRMPSKPLAAEECGDKSKASSAEKDSQDFDGQPCIAASPSSVTRRDYNVGGLSLGEYLGVTYHRVLKYMEIALDKGWYLKEPYYLTWKLDEEGMNCEGFIYAHLCNAFADRKKVHDMIGPYGTCPGWNCVVAQQGIQYSTYTGDNWEELCDYIVNDDLIQPGDIIWMWEGTACADGLTHKLSNYHHIAFYIGDYFDYKNVDSLYWQPLSGKDGRLRIWHSTGDTPPEMGVRSGNVTTRMYGMAHTMPCSISVFPINNGARGLKIITSPTQPEGSDGFEAYPLEGARYSIFSDFNLTREAESIVTDADGVALSHSLRPGTYYVKETEAPFGYILDPKVHSFIISPDLRGFVKMRLTCEPDLREEESEDKSAEGVDIFDGKSFMAAFAGEGIFAPIDFKWFFDDGKYKENIICQ